MILTRRLAAAALLALGAAALAAPRPQASAPAADYYVMRHLQKDPAGDPRDPGLTAAGQREAARLATWFGRHPPRAIYVSRTRRAAETAAAVAAKFKVTPKVYNPSDTAALVAAVRQERGTVLIVGHSNTVPDIVAGLGGTRPAPLADGDYGDIWHVWGGKPHTKKLSLSPPMAAAR
jgi:phosphohistidine phosphatase SixA